MLATIQIRGVPDAHADSDGAGADELLPMLIYAFIKGMPRNPWSNLEYIRRFRSEALLEEQHRYYITGIRFVPSMYFIVCCASTF